MLAFWTGDFIKAVESLADSIDWGALADVLSGEEFASVILLMKPVWRKGSTVEERYGLLEEKMRSDIADAVAIMRSSLEKNPSANKQSQIIESFAKRMRGAIRRYYYIAYDLGKQRTNIFSSGFTEEQLAQIEARVQREYEYLRGFTAKLRETVSNGQVPGFVEWRADLYGKNLKRVYQEGIVAEAHHGDMVVIRPGPVKTQHCPVCPTRWGTWTWEQYKAFDPPGPPANWCLGMSNCHCSFDIITARQPSVQEIAEAMVAPGAEERFEPGEE